MAGDYFGGDGFGSFGGDNLNTGLNPAFVFNPWDAGGPNPQDLAPVMMNVNSGVPGLTGPSNSFENPVTAGGAASPVANALIAGQAAAAAPPSQGPVLWYAILFAVGVIILGTVAHVDVRD